MSEPLKEREKEIMEEHKKMTDNLIENYELRLEYRQQYEDTLIDEITKRDHTISCLKSLIGGLVGAILVLVTTYFIG